MVNEKFQLAQLHGPAILSKWEVKERYMFQRKDFENREKNRRFVPEWGSGSYIQDKEKTVVWNQKVSLGSLPKQVIEATIINNMYNKSRCSPLIVQR